eukprot:2759833-Lingulodinium_polyedra.AAC.1
MWTGERCALAGYEAASQCTRCSSGSDSVMHRVWHCSASRQLQLPGVLKSDQLVKLAVQCQPDELAFWGRGLIPWPWLGLSEPADDMR